MKVVWNKVTPLSKALALVLFAAMPFIGFWFGTKYGLVKAVLDAGRVVTTVVTPANTGAEYYRNVAEWAVQRDDNGGFSISLPIGFPTQWNPIAPISTDWREDANGAPGAKWFSFGVPAIFEPQTDFLDAALTVGNSADRKAVSECLSQSNWRPPTTTSTVDINGVTFTVFQSMGAAAGNIYDTTSYRAIHNGKCYAIEYVIHSTHAENFPEEYHIQHFDKAKLTDLLDRIVRTFKFL